MKVDVACVRKLFRYDQISGTFRWRIKRLGVRRGRIAGYVDTLGYRRVKIQYKDYYVHRVIWLYMTGEWPLDQIDHIDGNKANNVWGNLREATNLQNFVNYTELCRTKFKVPYRNIRALKSGVYQVVIAKKVRGSYPSLEEAIEARGQIGTTMYGEFWRLK